MPVGCWSPFHGKQVAFYSWPFVSQVVPMLPKLLCEELCSLNPMTDRLTFSVIWKLTPEGKVTLGHCCRAGLPRDFLVQVSHNRGEESQLGAT